MTSTSWLGSSPAPPLVRGGAVRGEGGPAFRTWGINCRLNRAVLGNLAWLLWTASGLVSASGEAWRKCPIGAVR
jgi:hypothetical protein